MFSFCLPSGCRRASIWALLLLGAIATTNGSQLRAEDKGKKDAPVVAGTKAGQEWAENGLKMKFCWCPAGKFTMGSPKGEKGRSGDEDQVSVTLSRGFWLGKYELTQGE